MDFSTRYKITLSFDKAKGKKLDISAVGPGPALPDDNVTIEDDDTN